MALFHGLWVSAHRPPARRARSRRGTGRPDRATCASPPPCVPPTSSVLSQVGGLPVANNLLNETFSKGHFKYFSFIKPVPAEKEVASAEKEVASAQKEVASATTAKPSPPLPVEKKWWHIWKGGKKTRRNKSIKNIKRKKTKRRV